MQKEGIPGGGGHGKIYPRKKGDKALPGAGYPKGVPNAKTRLKAAMAMVLERKNHDGILEKKTIAEWIDAAAIKEAMDGNMRAYAEILDRTEGKVTQPVDMEGNLFAQKIEVGVVNVDRPLLSDESQLEKR